MTIYTEYTLYKVASILKSDLSENPEYDRALIEFVSYLTGDTAEVVSAKLIKQGENNA